MKKSTLVATIASIILIAVVAIGAYFYLENKKSNQPVDIESVAANPLDYLVFELKKEDYSEFQTERAFDKFNTSKNNIETALANGENIASDGLYYDWLNITGAMHMIGDYDREVALLKWFTLVYPGNSVSPSNLGTIYKSFIVDNEQSEKYYLIALEREKKFYDIYYGLYELYRYNFNDSDKAVNILEDGRKNNPEERNFVVDLIDYYILLDEKDKANKILDEWLVDHPEDFSLKSKI